MALACGGLPAAAANMMETKAFTTGLAISNSGGPLSSGTVVVADMTTNNTFTTTADASSTTVVGVLYDAGCANGTVCRVAVAGGVIVNNGGTAVNRGQLVVTDSNVGKAAGITGNPAVGASIGVWLEPVVANASGRVVLR